MFFSTELDGYTPPHDLFDSAWKNLSLINQKYVNKKGAQHFWWGVFTARQDYFTHFEPSQTKGGAKTEDPREEQPDHPQAELGLSHIDPS